jgi:calpain, invertebrate
MSFKDWRTIYNNLFCCVKFDESWSGKRYEGQWTSESSGGTPVKADTELMKKWAENPQFICELNNKNQEKTSLVITLGQEDGRMKRGLKFPFKENINSSCFTVMKLEKDEAKATM